jgi:hypothetical protein
MFLKRKPFRRLDEPAGAGASDTITLTAEQIEQANADALKAEEAGTPGKTDNPATTDEFGQPIVKDKSTTDPKPASLDGLGKSLDEMDAEHKKNNPVTDEEKAAKETADKLAAEEAKKKAPAAAVDKKAVVADDSEFEISVPAAVVDPNAPADEEQSSWFLIAKETGLGDLKADDFDNFKTTLSEKLAAERKAGKEEAANINMLEEFPAEVQSEAKEAIALLRSGKSLSALVEPLRPYQEVLAMNNEDRVRAMYSGQGHKEEWINQEIERQKEAGMIDHMGEQIGTNVTNMMDAKKNEIVSQAEKSVAQTKATIIAEREKEDASIIEELRRRSTYMGGKLTDKAKEHLEAKWKNGEYRRRLKSDSAFLVDAMLQSEFGPQAIEAVRKTEFEKGRGIAREKLHNTKGGVGAESGRHTPGTEVAKGFDGWAEIFNSEEQGLKPERIN